MTTLYVDDDWDDLQLFKEAIEKIDSSVICLTATSAPEALMILDNGAQPDLIFIDIVMPGMDGITCLHKIRQIEKFQMTKIVLMTISPYPFMKEAVEKLGASFMIKPSNYTELVQIFASYFNNQGFSV